MPNTRYTVVPTLGVELLNYTASGTTAVDDNFTGMPLGATVFGSDGRKQLLVKSTTSKNPAANLTVSSLFTATAAASAGVATYIVGSTTTVPAGARYWARKPTVA
jgi:hypothetical protein